MRYESIHDLPFVCQYNLPEPALHVYKDAFNRAWSEQPDEREARLRAFAAVRQRFEKDAVTGRWIAKGTSAPHEAGHRRAAGALAPCHPERSEGTPVTKMRASAPSQAPTVS